MAVRGFFYNATDLNDKEHMYNGQDMNEDKAPFYKEGVAYGHLQVTAAGGMEVTGWTAAPGRVTPISICTPSTTPPR
mgnify:CR=1 FL=1